MAIAPQVVAQLTPPSVLLLAREDVSTNAPVQLDQLRIDGPLGGVAGTTYSIF